MIIEMKPLGQMVAINAVLIVACLLLKWAPTDCRLGRKWPTESAAAVPWRWRLPRRRPTYKSTMKLESFWMEAILAYFEVGLAVGSSTLTPKSTLKSVFH